MLLDYPHRPIATSDARFERLRARYRAYRAANDGRKPLYYRRTGALDGAAGGVRRLVDRVRLDDPDATNRDSSVEIEVARRLGDRLLVAPA